MPAFAIRLRALALLLVAGCGSSKSGPIDAAGPLDAAADGGDAGAAEVAAPDALAPRISKGVAGRDALVAGFIIDDETELPVPAAQVLVNGVPMQAQGDGSFTVAVTAGRARIELRSNGYLDAVREMVASRYALPLQFRMAQRRARQLVGSAGGIFTFRESTLLVPAGAFASDTPVSLTYLGRTRVAGVVAWPQFLDQQGIPRRALALLDLASDAPPVLPVRVRVPVPADAAGADVSGFVVEGGRWTTAVAPDEMAGGFALFTMKAAAQLGVAVDARHADGQRLGYLVVERGDTDKIAGDVLPARTDVAPSHRPFAFVDARGARVDVAPRAWVRLGTIAPEAPLTAETAPYAGRMTLLTGRARVLTPLPATPLVTLAVEAQVPLKTRMGG